MKRITLAIQMDNINDIEDRESDTTLTLAAEAQNRNYNILYYRPNDLSYNSGEIEAKTYDLILKENKFYSLKNLKVTKLKDVDIILMRQNPPFDLKYITYTHLLDIISKDTLIINNPCSVRNCPEKIIPLQFPNLIPQTLISMDYDSIQEFYKRNKKIVLKPLYEYGGNDITLIEENNSDFSNIINKLLKKYDHPIIAQAFINEVHDGDKRIVIINGEIAGIIKRKPKKGSIISNLVCGGEALKANLSERDIEICNTISPYLKERNLFLVGIDIIGNYLTEINVTSPTGIPSINKLYNKSVESLFWDVLEEKFLK